MEIATRTLGKRLHEINDGAARFLRAGSCRPWWRWPRSIWQISCAADNGAGVECIANNLASWCRSRADLSWCRSSISRRQAGKTGRSRPRRRASLRRSRWGEVGRPLLIRRIARELAIEDVVGIRRPLADILRQFAPPGTGFLAVNTHQPLDAVRLHEGLRPCKSCNDSIAAHCDAVGSRPPQQSSGMKS